MSSLRGRISELARGPRGKQLRERAQRLARDPATRQKFSEARERLASRRSRPPR